jgi:hypothetical protein
MPSKDRIFNAVSQAWCRVRGSAGTGGKVPTSLPAGQTHILVVVHSGRNAFARIDVLPGRSAGGRGDVRCLCGLAEVDEDARDPLSVTNAISRIGCPQRGQRSRCGRATSHRTQRALRTRPWGPSFLLLAEIRKAIPAEACRQKPNGRRARERLRFRGPGPRRNWLRLGVGFRPHERSVRAGGSR